MAPGISANFKTSEFLLMIETFVNFVLVMSISTQIYIHVSRMAWIHLALKFLLNGDCPRHFQLEYPKCIDAE